MSKIILRSLIMFLSLVVFLNAGEKVRVAKVALGNTDQRNFIESLQLKVIDINERTLTTLLDEQNEKLLTSRSTEINFVSNLIDEDEIYLVNINRKLNKQATIAEGDILSQSGSNLLVKSESGDLSLQPGVIAIPAEKIKNYFRNEKTIYNSVQSDALDSLINSVVTKIDAESVESYIQGLQDYGTRYAGNDNRKTVALWIKDQFEAMGYTDVVLDSFQIDTRYFGLTWQYNVVATYPAFDQSENVVIVGGHHDSITSDSFSDPDSPAPGADDNASGTVAVLETAKALMEANFKSEANIKFMTFAAEELGLYGSFYFAGKAADNNTNIKFMINHDMISSSFESLQNAVVDINYYSGSEIYSELALDNVDKFTLINGQIGQRNSSGSDSFAFYSNGFYAVYFEESQFSPYYHSADDLITNYDMEFCAEVIKASAATLISGSVAPASVNNYQLADVGDGSSIYAEWDLSTESDVVSYKVYLGTESGIYTEEYEINENSITLENLNEGEEYFVGISVIDTDGYESFIIERSKTPNSIPLPPTDFVVEPVMYAVNLEWSPNEELDLAGYNVYRSFLGSEEPFKLNEEVITVTEFVDNDVMSAVYYEYFVKSVDTDGNESEKSDVFKSRAVTLDAGILLVDETADGDGSLFNPTDKEVDEFYKSILLNYQRESFDLQVKSKIDLADLGAYSAVIWYGDDKTDQSAKDFTEAIADYLDFGGKFLYSGYRPSKTFGGVTSVASEFNPGDFLYDYFKLSGINYSLLAKFKGANDLNNEYVDLTLDPAKINSDGDEHINGIETFTLVDSSSEIYEYYTTYAANLPQGALSGKPVGTEYIGEDFSTIILSFPLYYMEENLAEQFIDYVITQKFGLTTGVEEDNDNVIPTNFSLSQNYPNPFNPTTRIEYSIPVQEKVTVKIFDILGREVTTLVNELKSAGNHSVDFNAVDLSSGVYFYTIKAGSFTATKKLVVLK